MRSGWYIISKRTGSSTMLLWIIPKCTKDLPHQGSKDMILERDFLQCAKLEVEIRDQK